MNNIPVGYKQTEVGVIPEDWEECYLSDAVDFLDGQRRPIKSSEREKVKGIYPYYGASGIIDYVNDYIFNEELILLGEDGENILSRNLPLAFQVKGKIWVNNHAHVLKPKENFDIIFLTNFLESLDYSLLNSGTAQPKLNKQSCLKIKIAKPTKIEQAAIATALSDVDALISALDNLIAKKRLIKQGAMQELLSGKKHLAGVSQIHTSTVGAGSKPALNYATNNEMVAALPLRLRLESGEGLEPAPTNIETIPDNIPKGYKQTEIGMIPEDWEVKTFG
jgi:type I restriction enzyme S subunit